MQKSAYEAKQLGFLRDDDIIVMNTKEILLVAIKKAQLMALAGYQLPLKQKVPVFGETGIATIKDPTSKSA
ncbi:hypothetical protein ACP8HZ_07430 [Francisella noatunensis]